jgi:hypothetical protein
VAQARRRRIALIVALRPRGGDPAPVGARATANRWHDDSLWANSLRSLGGLEVPFDFAIFLQAAEDVRAGDSPYVDPTPSREATRPVRVPAAPRDRR